MSSLKNLRALVPSTGANISSSRRRLGNTSRVRKNVKLAGDRPTQMPELIPGYGDVRAFLR